MEGVEEVNAQKVRKIYI